MVREAVDDAQLQAAGFEEAQRLRRRIDIGGHHRIVRGMARDEAHIGNAGLARIDDALGCGHVIGGSPQSAMRQRAAAADEHILLAERDVEARFARSDGGGQPSGAGTEDREVAVQYRVCHWLSVSL